MYVHYPWLLLLLLQGIYIISSKGVQVKVDIGHMIILMKLVQEEGEHSNISFDY